MIWYKRKNYKEFLLQIDQYGEQGHMKVIRKFFIDPTNTPYYNGTDHLHTTEIEKEHVKVTPESIPENIKREAIKLKLKGIIQ